MAVTSLLAIALVPMLGILSAKETYSFFGAKVTFFILGAFMLSAALIATGLSQRVAMLFVRSFGGTPSRLVLAVFALSAAGSMVMSEHAVAVMVFPIVQDIAAALRLRKPESGMGKALFFGMAWGCVVGGTLTVLGGGRGPLAIGILEEATGGAASISFMGYVAYSWPVVLPLLVAAALLIRRSYVLEIRTTDVAIEALQIKLREMGKLGPREAAVGLVVVITVALWALTGESVGLANIALVSMAALFALGALRWDDIQKHVNWGIVVMYGGAICLGAVMDRTGAAAWVTREALGAEGLDPRLVMFAMAAAAAVLTEFMSNSAVVAMVLPPALSLAEANGIDPRAMTMAVVLSTNFAYVLPMGTPVMALGWASGFFAPGDVLARGTIMMLLSIATMAFVIFAGWPLLGLV
jgi:sodium-dependent dicarboxylate transporter 2/3/5